MSASYDEGWRARFGEEAGMPSEVPDVPWLRQVLVRRTHRRYAERPVADSLMRLLLGAAFSASSKSDFQQASVVWVKDRGQRDRLASLIPDMPWIGNAPVFLVFCGDARRLERIGELRGRPQENGKLEGFFNAAVDAALVLQSFILAAETAGLGCCPISVLRNHADAVAEILSLPDKVFPVAGICVGYPAVAGHISMRLPLDATVHTNRYDSSGCQNSSMPTSGGAMRAIRCRASSSACRMFSAMPRFTAGRKTRRARRPNPKARASRPICAAAGLPSINRCLQASLWTRTRQRLHSPRHLRPRANA